VETVLKLRVALAVFGSYDVSGKKACNDAEDDATEENVVENRFSSKLKNFAIFTNLAAAIRAKEICFCPILWQAEAPFHSERNWGQN
jgi:hypothetical protein